MTTEMDDGTGIVRGPMTGDLTNPVTQVSFNYFNSLVFEKATESNLFGEVRFRFDHQALSTDLFANHGTGLFTLSGLDDSELVLLEMGNRFVKKLPVPNRFRTDTLHLFSDFSKVTHQRQILLLPIAGLLEGPPLVFDLWLPDLFPQA